MNLACRPPEVGGSSVVGGDGWGDTFPQASQPTLVHCSGLGMIA